MSVCDRKCDYVVNGPATQKCLLYLDESSSIRYGLGLKKKPIFGL